MIKTLITIAVAAVLASSSAWATPELSQADREGVIQVWALSKWVARTAAWHCDNMAVNFVTMFAAKNALEITEAERLRGEKWVTSDLDNLAKAEHAIGRTAWCASAYRLYGPNGMGLIKDKE